MHTDHASKTDSIQLSFYRPEHYESLMAFSLPEEQLTFTALPEWELEHSIENPTRHPIVIMNAETPVGFFILHYGEEIEPFSTNPKAILLRAFLVDQSHQGKGYAKTAMSLLPSFVREHFPDQNEIVLAVNERNVAAKQLYEKSGFQDRGTRRQGERGMQYLLQLPLT